ncbi:hypothetical protein [Phytoactinopolyspora limicola]|uniref:hypothetical protein n=1 Tax=Phytoactinopolyspora limicola TaxID=2715536 RepID=UPI0014072F28|nr:hypothetical protein [Phytoactinopolyspora limicola]
MANTWPPDCPVQWCTVQVPAHRLHQATLDTWRGEEPEHPNPLRVLHLVRFAHEPAGSLSVRSQLALSVTGPDLLPVGDGPSPRRRGADRVSVTLPASEWRRVVEQIARVL